MTRAGCTKTLDQTRTGVLEARVAREVFRVSSQLHGGFASEVIGDVREHQIRLALHTGQGWTDLQLEALCDQRLECFTRALRDESGSSVTGGSSGAGMVRRSALNLERFSPSSVPRGLRNPSGLKAIIVSALNRCALNLEINLALQLELLDALHLELRGRRGFQIQRARQASQ